MLFNSLSFLLFFVAVFIIYWILPHRARWVLLLVASYFFYACWNPAYLLLIFGATLVAYVFGRLIEIDSHRKKLWLICCLVLSFGALIYFKYLDLFGQSANGLFAYFGVSLNIPLFNILLPIGISFQTFQNVGYAIDVYRGTIKSEKNFFRYALFAAYFPQLVAGPIERASHLMPQLAQKHTFSYSETTLGLRMMLIGFFKKVAIADTIAIYVDIVYNNLDSGFTGFALMVATFLFAFQIYCDFSGYSDIAIGASKTFGIQLVTNFKSPYCATNPQDFWRRWHISLSSWFQDYVYIPLGGSRVRVPRYILNLLITFTISGLWHGASWNFVIWGALHGLLIAGYVLIKRVRKRKSVAEKNESSHLGFPKRILSTIVTFILVDIAWIFFRANSFEDACYIFQHLFSGWEFNLAFFKSQLLLMGFDKSSLIFVVCLLAVLFVIDLINYRQPIAEVIGRQKLIVRWSIYLLGSVTIILAFMFTAQSQNFIYFQF